VVSTNFWLQFLRTIGLCLISEGDPDSIHSQQLAAMLGLPRLLGWKENHLLTLSPSEEEPATKRQFASNESHEGKFSLDDVALGSPFWSSEAASINEERGLSALIEPSKTRDFLAVPVEEDWGKRRDGVEPQRC